MSTNYKKIIFLDIDGVLASIPYLCTGKGYIEPKKCELLNTLEDIGAEIVISSSWGYDNGKTEKSLRECGLTLPIIGYTDHFHQDWLCRGNEIEKWLRDNCGGMCTKYGCDDDDGEPYYRKHNNDTDIDYEYVIFDDDCDFLLGQREHFIKVHNYTGLTKRDIKKARKLLTRDETQDSDTDQDVVEDQTLVQEIQEVSTQ